MLGILRKTFHLCTTITKVTIIVTYLYFILLFCLLFTFVGISFVVSCTAARAIMIITFLTPVNYLPDSC